MNVNDIEDKKNRIISEYMEKFEELERNDPNPGVLDYHLKEHIEMQNECLSKIRSLYEEN